VKAGGKQRLFISWLTLLTLKMEPTYYSETSVDFQSAARRYIPEHSIPHDHRCKNLNPNFKGLTFTLAFAHIQDADSDYGTGSMTEESGFDSISTEAGDFLFSTSSRPILG
jgi:hypothetical protein